VIHGFGVKRDWAMWVKRGVCDDESGAAGSREGIGANEDMEINEMSSAVDWLNRRLYPSYSRNWDDELFRERIIAYLHPSSVVLDPGAGAGIVPQMNFRVAVGQMCGVDLDPRVIDNPMLDEGRVAKAAGIPYEDGRFDVVFFCSRRGTSGTTCRP